MNDVHQFSVMILFGCLDGNDQVTQSFVIHLIRRVNPAIVGVIQVVAVVEVKLVTGDALLSGPVSAVENDSAGEFQVNDVL